LEPEDLTPDDIQAKHLKVLLDPQYPYSLDRQQRTIEYLQEFMKAGGEAMLQDPRAQEVVQLMAERTGQTTERIEAVCFLANASEVRRALRATPGGTRDRLKHERVYPTGGWLGAYLDYSILSEQPLPWHFWAGAAVLGAACRRNLYMDLGFGDVLFPNIYTLLVGTSGLGKNQVINRGVRVLKKANHLARVKCVEDHKDYQVAVLNEVTAESLVAAMSPGQIEVPDTGVMVEREESCGLLVNPETATLLGKSRRELSERLLTYLTDMYNGDPKAALTITKGARTLGPCSLTLILGSTAEWIGTSVTQAVISGGFTGRCVFVERSERHRIKYREIPTDHVPDPVQENELARMLVPWMVASPIEATMEEDTQGWWEEWYIKHRQAECPHESLEGWWQRKPVHLAKLAMLITASDLCRFDLDLGGVRSMPVTLRTMQTALQLLDLEQARIPKVLEQIDRAPEVPIQAYVKEKLRTLMKRESDPVTHTRLFFACRWRVGTTAKMRLILDSLYRAAAYTLEPTMTEKKEAHEGKRGRLTPEEEDEEDGAE
jgi:hypothetical protein